jgi:hypothetical protein
MPRMEPSLDHLSAARAALESNPAASKRRQRSAVTNGSRPFLIGDSNSAWTRRWKDLVVGHTNDKGGADYLSEAQISLIKRASALELECERMEGRLSMGHDIPLESYAAAVGHLRRVFEAIGLERKPREVPSLRTYLNGAPAE